MNDWHAVLDRVTDDARAVLGEALTGVYVHGSIAMGCFTWERSDVDYLLVVERPLVEAEKLKIIRDGIALLPDAPPKGLEMSVMLRSACNPFVHPAPFELHFSMDHLELFERSPEAYLARMRGVDPDLAAHCTVLWHRGFVHWGAPIDEVFGPVAPTDYLDSIWRDVMHAEVDILENTVYVALNLCRVLAYLEEGTVLSKREGGEWGQRNLPARWSPLLGWALAVYRGEELHAPEAGALTAFAREQLGRIRERGGLV